MATDSTRTSTPDSPHSTASTPVSRTADMVGLAPPRISVAATIATVLIAAGLTAWLTNAYAAVAVITATSAAFAAVVHAINHDSLTVQLLGNLVVPGVGLGFVIGVLLGAVQSAAMIPVFTVFAFIALGGAVFGATATTWADIGDRDIYKTLKVLPATILPATLIVGGMVWQSLNVDAQSAITTVVGTVIGGLLDAVLSTSGSPAVLVASFCGIIAVTLYLLRRALRTVPVVELAPRDKATEVEDTVGQTRWYLRWVMFAFAGGALAGVAAAASGKALSTLLPPVVANLITVIAGAAVLRYLAIAVSVVCFIAVASIRVANKLSNISPTTLVRRGVPLAAGTLITIITLTVAANPLYNLLATRSPASVTGLLDQITGMVGVPVFILFLVLVVMCTFIGLALLPVLLAGAGFLPKRTAAPALAGGGVVLVGILHGVLNGDALVVFTFIGLGAIAWDVGEYAVTLGETIGQHATTTRTEVVHIVVSVASAIGAVVAAWVTLSAAGALTVTTMPVLVFLFAGAAYLLFTMGLRG